MGIIDNDLVLIMEKELTALQEELKELREEKKKLRSTLRLIKHYICEELPDENCKDWLKSHLAFTIDYALREEEDE